MRFPSRWIVLGLSLAVVPGQAPGQETSGPPPGPTSPLTLPEAIEMALEFHPVVGEARAQVEVAGGVLNQTRSSLLPALVSDASLTRHREPMLVAPLHGFDPTMAPAFDQSLVRGNLTLSYSLFDGGARRARIDRAEAGAAAAHHGWQATEMNLTAEVSGAYLAVLSSVELMEASVRLREALEAEEGRVRQFLSEGKAARVDLLRVQASLSQAEATEISLRSRLEVAQGRLARLLGLGENEVRDRGLAGAALRALPVEPTPVVVGRAKEVSPELALARQQLVGARAGVREANASFLPNLRVAGAYSDFGTLEGGHVQEWQGSLQVSYPVFTGGAREGERQRAEAEERRVSEALRRIELAVEEGVEEATAAAVESRARREALERAVTQAEEVARIEALALEVGAGVQTDFLRAQAEFYQSQAALAEARHGETMAGIQLARVTGDLTLEWVREKMEVVR
jgi:adhesin transport system outer membrane protein